MSPGSPPKRGSSLPRPSARVRPRPYSLRDLGTRLVEGYVLPHAKHCPTVRCQCVRDPLVTLAIAFDLRSPIASIASRLASMLGATVPEAPVNEHGNSRSREDPVDLRSNAALSAHEEVLPESEAIGVQGATQGDFRLRIRTTVRLQSQLAALCSTPTGRLLKRRAQMKCRREPPQPYSRP